MNQKFDAGTNEIQSPKSRAKMPKTILRGSVLCIFDDAETGRRIESAMAAENFSILRARHGMHAYWLGLNSKPDLIITDAVGKESSFLLDCLARNAKTASIPVIGMVDTVQQQVADQPLSGLAAVVKVDASSAELRQVADELVESNVRIDGIEKKKKPARQPVPINGGVADHVDAIFSEIGHAAARRPNIAPYIGSGSVTSETIGSDL